MSRVSLIYWLAVLGGLSANFFSSCAEKEASPPWSRTVIAYMVADNNLDHFVNDDINEMEEGWNSELAGNLLVYVDRAKASAPAHPVVYKIKKDTSKRIVSDIVSVYKEHVSTDPAVVHEVLSKIIGQFPASSYGLILWSHGTGWYPADAKIDISSAGGRLGFPVTKSFGRDVSEETDIAALKDALPIKFEYLIFDACYMGAIETVYELREKANYIIASPTVVLSSGFPYRQIVPHLFEREMNYKTIAEKYFASYDSLSGALQTASLSAVKTSALPILVHEVRQLLSRADRLAAADVSSLQQFSVVPGYFFDLGQFIESCAGKSPHFQFALRQAVPITYATKKIADELEISKNSGLSIFVPQESMQIHFSSYKKYEWFKDSNYANYFSKFGFK